MMNNLYRQVILEHYKNPRNKGLKNEEGYKTLRVKNPSCGDDVTVQIKVENNQVKDIRHDGSGCSICCASASVMCDVLKNHRIDEVEQLIQDFYELVKGNELQNIDELEDAAAFSGVSQFPARVKCASLAWRGIDALLNGSTEDDIDE